MKNIYKYKTVEERASAFQEWCCKTKYDHECEDSISCDECHFEWLELEAEEEKPLPCPFCGGKSSVIVYHEAQKEWVSCICGYSSKIMDEGCSISAHNRVARAVIGSEKELQNEND